ncbi:MAG: class A beta-lactamase-related serine hydrolase [Hyphomicrobiales bacterium]|nr:MAG: class A beta-lactamase-related serine hydrolase [Hyphomicrobiales bacterium]
MSIQGRVAAGFESVADAFARAFDGRPTMGAALAIRHKGEEVVSLWGGTADERAQAAWGESTASVIFSCTKGLVSILAARLVEEGRLDYAAPVARYWPEFAAGGKDRITVGDVLAHRAGLSAPADAWSFDDLLDWSVPTSRLARQSPLWSPGSGYAYHAITHGWLAGEIIRRVAGQSVGTCFAEAVTAPLDVPAWIGLPSGFEGQVAHLQLAPTLENFWDAEAARDAVAPNWPYRAMTLGGALPPTLVTSSGAFNDRRLQSAEIPGAGGIATASALASIWSATVTPTAGVQLLQPGTVALATRAASAGPPVFDAPPPYARWGMGFQLDSEARRYLTATSFGHDGAGGQSAFADPEHAIGFAFITNWLEAGNDDRATAIIDALRQILG